MGKDNVKGEYTIAPIFIGGNDAYWKDNMYVYLMSVDKMFV